MGLFNRKKPENRADTGTISYEDSLLQALLGDTEMTKAKALQIPTVASAIDFLANIVAGTPIKLYRLDGDKVKEVKDDPRIALLNDDTGDTLNAHDFWRALISDYYLGKGGYAYINKVRGKVASLHYVDETFVTPVVNTDHIFKDYDFLVDGKSYKPFEFIKLLRNSKDGASGTGIVKENSDLLTVAYQTLVFEQALVKKGGNKKGFLKSEGKLDDPSMEALRAAWKRLYSNNEENVIVLNKGMDFQESSNTSVEMQLNENKLTNSDELCKIFHVSAKVIRGEATEADMQAVAKVAAIPLFKVIECALNRDLLLEKEKKGENALYWAFDTKELLKGNFKDRMEGYKAAIDSKVMMPSEARFIEDMEQIEGLDIIPMGLADVIFDVKTQTYFTPNTRTITSGTENVQVEPIITNQGGNTA